MLQDIGKAENIPTYIDLVKRKETSMSLPKLGKKANKSKPLLMMGFGHRVYKTTDPRVEIVKSMAMQLFKLIKIDAIGELAIELEKYCESDAFMIEKKLYPNVDYWTAIILHTMGFPTDMFPVWLTLPRYFIYL